MRQFIKSFFASFLAIIAVIVLMIAVFTGMFIGTLSSLGSKSKTIVNKNSILLIDLDHTYSDNATSNSIAALLSEDADKPSIYQVTESIKKAGTDNNIEGIYIKMGDPELGKANLSQFRDALLEFKKSNKFIYAYGENISQSAYYIATVADSIFMNPHGGLSFQGLSSQILFFKGLLDKLEIKPEIFYAGKFKSATEPFRLEQASPENKEQLAKLQETIWEDYMAAVHMKTGLDNEQINDLVNNFKIQFPQDAVTYKLIDGLRYKDEVIASLLTKLKVDEESDLNLVALNDYAMNMEQTSKASDRIAILVAEGSIVDGKAEDEGVIASEDFVKEIKKVAKDEDIKAVVLRINSPGGSGLASEVMLRELELLRAKKPLIVSMGDVAASGGYYIACKADSIFANTNTITGSIGVFSMFANLTNTLKNKLGITFDGVKTAPYADFPSPMRPLTDAERDYFQRSVDTFYQTFLSRVAAGRNMSKEQVHDIAQGRVWTGALAKQLGLVDEIGNLDRAINSAVAMAKLKDYSIDVYPKPTDKLKFILNKMSDNVSTEVINGYIASKIGQEQYTYFSSLHQFIGMNGKVMALAPFTITVK